MAALANTVVPHTSCESLKLTGIQVYRKEHLLLTSPAYGAGMTLDCLEEMKLRKLIGSGDTLVFVGSMGSLGVEIKLGDIVLPNPAGCAYYGYEGVWLEQDRDVLDGLRHSLAQREIQAVEYKHGSSFAVFDPHTDLATYTSSLYDDTVAGVDCSEVYVGFDFAGKNVMTKGAVLYCSDSPDVHIADVKETEFARRASDADLLLNQIAAELLATLNPITRIE